MLLFSSTSTPPFILVPFGMMGVSWSCIYLAKFEAFAHNEESSQCTMQRFGALEFIHQAKHAGMPRKIITGNNSII